MIQREIEQLIQPSIESLGYILWGTEYKGQGQHSLLRIYIDREQGIGIHDCERVSRQVSALLDVSDPISGYYTLEVSSPGTPRPLFASWQYQAYIGHVVDIKLVRPEIKTRKFTGTILAADESTLSLSIEGETKAFLFSNIMKASLAV